MSQKNHTSSRMENRKTKRVLRKRVYFLLIPLVLIIVAASVFASLWIKADSVISDSYEDDGRDKSSLRTEKVDPDVDNVSILIIGVDESDHRANESSSRSDTLMLATFNKDEKSVKLISIPRDSLVYIPEVGYEDKINHAHAYGGPKASMEAVENLLDIPVDYFVKVNFHAFVDVVDAIGGITAEVPYEFYESDSNDKKNAIHLLPGEQLLNGEEALALARTRKLDNDIERGKRQMEIIKSIASKTASVGSIFKLDDVMEAVGNNMTTNLSFDEMRSFLSYATSGRNIDIESMTLKGEDYQPNGIYYWKLDEVALNETKQLIKSHLNIDTDDTNQNTFNALEDNNNY